MNFKTMDRRIVTIFLIVFVQILGASLVLPILPLYAQRQFDLSPQQITLLDLLVFSQPNLWLARTWGGFQIAMGASPC